MRTFVSVFVLGLLACSGASAQVSTDEVEEETTAPPPTEEPEAEFPSPPADDEGEAPAPSPEEELEEEDGKVVDDGRVEESVESSNEKPADEASAAAAARRTGALPSLSKLAPPSQREQARGNEAQKKPDGREAHPAQVPTPERNPEPKAEPKSEPKSKPNAEPAPEPTQDPWLETTQEPTLMEEEPTEEVEPTEEEAQPMEEEAQTTPEPQMEREEEEVPPMETAPEPAPEPEPEKAPLPQPRGFGIRSCPMMCEERLDLSLKGRAFGASIKATLQKDGAVGCSGIAADLGTLASQPEVIELMKLRMDSHMLALSEVTIDEDYSEEVNGRMNARTHEASHMAVFAIAFKVQDHDWTADQIWRFCTTSHNIEKTFNVKHLMEMQSGGLFGSPEAMLKVRSALELDRRQDAHDVRLVIHLAAWQFDCGFCECNVAQCQDTVDYVIVHAAAIRIDLSEEDGCQLKEGSMMQKWLTRILRETDEDLPLLPTCSGARPTGQEVTSIKLSVDQDRKRRLQQREEL